MVDIDLRLGDCAELMKEIPRNSIDLTVTSPPYDDLRLYNGYSFDFEKIARELYRVTKPGGVVVWVVGDATKNGSETGTSFRQALYFMECGFNLHDTMIYTKAGNPFPNKLRYNAIFEYMFVLSVGKPSTVNLIMDKRNKYAGSKVARKNSDRQMDGSITENSAYKLDKNRVVKKHGIRDNVWRYAVGFGNSTSDKYAFKHPAMFPEALARDHIMTWSNPGDNVFDPMMGAGTTGKMAVLLNRNFMGCDVSSDYFAIAEKRIQEAQQQPNLFHGVTP